MTDRLSFQSAGMVPPRAKRSPVLTISFRVGGDTQPEAVLNQVISAFRSGCVNGACTDQDGDIIGSWALINGAA